MVPRPLQEINEADELQGNNYENQFRGISDGNNSSQNRQSPITQKGMQGGRQRVDGFDPSCQSNMSSGDYQLMLNQFNIKNKRNSECGTQGQTQTHRFEKISVNSSGLEIRNMPPGYNQQNMMGTIGSSHGVGSDDCNKQVSGGHFNKMEKKDSQQSFVSNFSYSQYDGGALDLNKILSGEEKRTNLMVRNVPCRYSQAEIRADFDRNHKNRFNDLKVPMDKEKHEKTGKGYCFINFRHVLFVYDFFHDKNRNLWPKYASDKIIEIAYATQQPIISANETITAQINGTSKEFKMSD